MKLQSIKTAKIQLLANLLVLEDSMITNNELDMLALLLKDKDIKEHVKNVIIKKLQSHEP